MRKWLFLPHECPNAYVHANTKDGGLGVPSIRWGAPLERLSRIEALRTSTYVEGSESGAYLEREITRVEMRSKDNNNRILRSGSEIDEFWSECLYKSFDGRPLRGSRSVKTQHMWIGEPTRFLSGRDYVNMCKLRINAMPTLSRTLKGRVRDRSCRGGCGPIETSNHVIQVCHRTHGVRIKRHDAICSFVSKRLTADGYLVEKEPIFDTAEGNRKPDLVATLHGISRIVDVQIRSEQKNLPKANHEKKNYYGNNRSLLKAVKDRYGSKEVTTTAVSLKWRGMWYIKSVEELLENKIIRKTDIKTISSRVLIGGIAAFKCFNRTTSVKEGWRRRRSRTTGHFVSL